MAQLEADKSGVSARDLKNINDLLPDSPATPQILTSIESISRESGVVIEAIELVLPEDSEETDKEALSLLPSGVAVVEVSITIASSSYDTLKTLLSNIEKNIRLMDVIAITYTPIGKSYNITLQAYYMSNL